MPVSPRFRSSIAALSVALVSCTGTQEAGAGSPGDCGEIAGSDETISEAAACHATFDPGPCRDAIDVLATAGPDAASALATCVLSAGERSDGVWYADAFATARTDDAVVALGNQFGDQFDVAVHGITFSASLDAEASARLGRVLDQLEPAARAVVVSLALSYRMDPLAEFAAPFADDVGSEDPGLRVYAEQLAESGEPLGPDDRRLLISTGVWTADDILDCYEGEGAGCEGWEGESPLDALLDVGEVDPGDGPAPNRAIRLIRSEDTDIDAIPGLVRIVGGAPYPNQGNFIGSVLLDMTSSTIDAERRRAIASGATARMCEYDILETYLLRAQTSDPDRHEHPDGPWPTFVRACAVENWDDDDLVSALSTGSWLGVPPAFYGELEERLASSSVELSCDEYHAMGMVAYERTPWVLMRGIAHVVVAEIAGSACDPLMTGYVERVADSDDEHPEARLRAVEWLLERGDDSRCRQIDDILDWFHPEYEVGPGPWAEALGATLEDRCD